MRIKNKILFGDKLNEFKKLDANEKSEIRNQFYTESYVRLKWLSLFIAVCQILFLLKDSLSGFYELNHLNYINLGIEIFMIVVSLLCFFVNIIFIKKEKYVFLMKIIHIVFLVMIAIANLGYCFTDMYVRHATMGVCLAFLFAPILIPFFSFWGQFLLYSFVIIGQTVIYFISFDTGITDLFSVIVLLILIYTTSNVTRFYLIRILCYRHQDKKLTEELKRRTNKDFLTDVFNRSCLYEDYENAKKSRKMIGLLMYDVDDFKLYNDAFSHLKGDQCLIDTCKKINEKLTSYHGKLYRYGGEEFVVLLEDIEQSSFEEVMTMVNKTIFNMKIVHSKKALYPFITISIGGSYIDTYTQSIEEALAICDTALYQAKANGKNCYVQL